jgi:tetratricopeptide (TPR) repeat protein
MLTIPLPALAHSGLAAAVILLSSSPAAADDAWVEVTTPHFTIVSNAGEKRARNMGWQFEQMQGVLARVWPWAKGSFEKPLVVYAMKDERSMRALAPQYWERGQNVKPTSIFLSAPEAHYIAVRTDVRMDEVQTNPYRASYWSYVGLTLTSSIPHPLPLWYSRGLSEVFSNTIVLQKEVLVGPILPWHFDTLRERSALPLEDLLTAQRDSAYMSSGERMAHFDASAWALLHYLTFGESGANLDRFNRFSVAVGKGADPRSALGEAFGGLPAVNDGYRRYVDRIIYTYKKVDLAVSVDQNSFGVKTLTAVEADVAMARYYAASDRPVDARAKLAAAGAAGPNGAIHEIEGLLLERERKRTEARAAYAKAVDLGGTSYYGEYRFASLSWPEAPDNTDPFPAMAKSLRRAIELRPAFAPAHAQLANVLLQMRQPAESLPAAREAVRLDPYESYHQLTLARALASNGKKGEAMAPARHAASLARSDFDKRQAAQMLERLQAPQ